MSKFKAKKLKVAPAKPYDPPFPYPAEWPKRECLGERDYYGEFDCGYPDPPTCEDCICNFEDMGGTIDPETGEDYRDE